MKISQTELGSLFDVYFDFVCGLLPHPRLSPR